MQEGLSLFATVNILRNVQGKCLLSVISTLLNDLTGQAFGWDALYLGVKV